MQLLNSTWLLDSGRTGGWINHPATRMWSGHRHALAQYGVAMCKEWICRGYRDAQLFNLKSVLNLTENTGMPSWLGDQEFHSSHRRALLVKNWEWYSTFGWAEAEPRPETYEYVWPHQLAEPAGENT